MAERIITPAEAVWDERAALESRIRAECEQARAPMPPDGPLEAQLRYLMDARDAELVAMRERAERAERTLAVERGDASQAPEGWTANYAGDMWTRTVSGRSVWVHRFAPHGVSMWEMRGIRRDDPAHREWSTALEAMEAIDAGVSDG